jgi:eukaryotic-like serine/threonine-protein kinase
MAYACEALVSAPVTSGEVVAGKYRVERVLGEGAMGVVVAATHLALEESVAIKIMRADLAHQSGPRERFIQEARISARLKSDHVARVMDVGQLPRGNPFIVMEYLDGRDLGEVLTERGAAPPEVAAGWIVEACDAVHEAHLNGVIHRDLKPENLFLAVRRDGSTRIKVLDFGVSKLIAAADGPPESRPRAMTNGAIGTPAYMAPEQMSATEHVGPHTDVWALGVILYELVSGRHPFEGATLAEFCGRILRDDPPPLAAVVPGVDPELSDIVRCAMQKDWRLRLPSASALRDRLTRLPAVGARPARHTPVDLCDTGSAADWTERRVAFTVASRAPSRGSGRWGWIAGAVMCALVGGAGVLIAVRGPDSASPALAAERASTTTVITADQGPVVVRSMGAVVEPVPLPATPTAQPSPAISAPKPAPVKIAAPPLPGGQVPGGSVGGASKPSPAQPPKGSVGGGLFDQRF